MPWREGNRGQLDSRPHSYPGRETEAWGCPLWSSLGFLCPRAQVRAPPFPPPREAPSPKATHLHYLCLRSGRDTAGCSQAPCALPAPLQGRLPRAP